MHTDGTIYVQSYVTAVGFPRTALELAKMREKYIGGATDLDSLLQFDSAVDLSWTAPQWVMTGDVVFFYFTRRGRTVAHRLLTELRHRGAGATTIKLVLRSVEQADRLAGTIFAFGLIAEPAEYEDVEEGQHFRGRIFAPLKEVRILTTPVPSAAFAKCFALARGGTNTPLSRDGFDCLSRLLLSTNPRDARLLRRRRGGDVGFRTLNRHNWWRLLRDERVRFLNETQVRAYFADYLLANVKDPRSTVLQECHCWRDGVRTGVADYFVQVAGRWWPVETKVSTATQRDLSGQLSKYLGVDEIQPTVGRRAGSRMSVAAPAGVLVIDQAGCQWVTRSGSRAWGREELSPAVSAFIRETIAAA